MQCRECSYEQNPALVNSFPLYQLKITASQNMNVRSHWLLAHFSGVLGSSGKTVGERCVITFYSPIGTRVSRVYSLFQGTSCLIIHLVHTFSPVHKVYTLCTTRYGLVCSSWLSHIRDYCNSHMTIMWLLSCTVLVHLLSEANPITPLLARVVIYVPGHFQIVLYLSPVVIVA